MSKVAVVYWSGTGNTEAMAQAIAEGAKGAGAEVSLLEGRQTSRLQPQQHRRRMKAQQLFKSLTSQQHHLANDRNYH